MTFAKLEAIRDYVLTFYGVNGHKFKKRQRNLVEARNVFFHISKRYGYIHADIGSAVKKDHSTVVHGLKVVENLCSYDKDFRNRLELCKESVYDKFGYPGRKMDIKAIERKIAKLEMLKKVALNEMEDVG